MRVKGSIICWLLLGLGLSGCAQLHNKTPAELVRYGIQRNLTQDNQYNFSGNIRLVVSPTALSVANTQDHAPVAASDAAVDVDTAAAQPTVAAESSAATTMDADVAEAAPQQQWVGFWAGALSMPFTGAVDWPQRRVEVVPALRYETRNALLWIKLPIQADLQSWSVVVDPAVVAPFVDMVGLSGKTPWGDRYLRISVPEHLYRDWPIEDLLATLPQAVDAGYASLDPKLYTRLPMDADGRRVGAHYRVGMKQTWADSQKMLTVMLDNVSAQLAADGHQQSRTATQQEKYRQMLAVLAMLTNVAKQPATLADDADVQVKALLDMPVQVEVYQDWRGRIVAMKELLPLPSSWLSDWLPEQVKGKESAANVVIWMQMAYTGKPDFVIHSNAANTQDISALYFSAEDPDASSAETTPATHSLQALPTRHQ